MSALQVQYYHHGRFHVHGGVIPDAITAYQTFGDPKNPCIVFPTCYGGKLNGVSHSHWFLMKLMFKQDSGLLGQSYLIGDDKEIT
jgi:hypothetical protein